ncbi:hypothetical protein PC119_g20674 [Phytophthora cactorum]|nr:hypothetical protein PC119_g20674 [Phytophthora cactorum]
MKYEHVTENQPMHGHSFMGNPNASATHATMLRTLPSTEQHGVALGFTVKELLDAATATTPFRTTPRVKLLELHVRSYVGKSVNLFSDGLSGSTLSLQLDVSSTSR